MLTNRKGEWGPFQLLITVIVMGLSLAIGAYLITLVSDWKCETDAKNQLNMFAERISTVGYGDIGGVDTVRLEIPSCVEALYLRGISASAGLNCQRLCPQHPTSCWVMIAETRTRGNLETTCIDVSGSTDIGVDNKITAPLSGSYVNDEWKSGAYPFYGNRGYVLRISKDGLNHITIGGI